MSRLRIRAAILCACAVTAAAAASGAHAQGRRPAAPAALRCAASDPARDTLGRRPLPRGYTIAISRDSSDVEYACIATLRRADGRIVRADSGFGAAVDNATGMDINGDGVPELVLEMDTGGGNHCCWNFTVISLGTPPRLLLRFEWSGAAEFRRDAGGQVTLWSWEGGLFGTEPSMASRLFAQRVYRFTDGKLADITPSQCAVIDADTAGYHTRPPDADALRRLATFGAASDSAYGIATDIELLMLQDVFCRRFDEALGKARAMWPARTRGAFIARFRALVVNAYPEYAAAMRDWKD